MLRANGIRDEGIDTVGLEFRRIQMFRVEEEVTL